MRVGHIDRGIELPGDARNSRKLHSPLAPAAARAVAGRSAGPKAIAYTPASSEGLGWSTPWACTLPAARLPLSGPAGQRM
jgi:hypothetical protein